MTPASEWDRWAARWQTTGAGADLDGVIERARRARRGTRRIRVGSAAMTLFAIAVVGAALWHAGNVLEVALGLFVAVAIAAMWIADAANDRRAAGALHAPEDEYLAARRALCARRIRFAHLGWGVVALDLIFLVPWWIGGVAVHGSGFHLIQILTIWSPVAIMSTFVAWTIRLRARARVELRQFNAELDR